MTNDTHDDSRGLTVLADALTSEQIAHLKEHWIETPEQFLSAVATEEGKAGMCRLLVLDGSQLEERAKQLAKGLSPEALERLQSTQPGGELGVILPLPPADRDDVEPGGNA